MAGSNGWLAEEDRNRRKTKKKREDVRVGGDSEEKKKGEERRRRGAEDHCRLEGSGMAIFSILGLPFFAISIQFML